ncbi:Mitochondrial antiviral-signaling protein [Tauraco erythrolophus]|uniref:Mitochondrial antiviral-signaling protein n=1 Tax=Tauraco erythrolophus TaxID=121530 RepID=A0A093CCH8_TAUER|nr:Mitochondrial antiviral-signaling protein [Tauraco erythrolophus]
MGFAEDKVYDYILKNLKNFKNIRVASLADSLSCLTDADRDELHSREETRGSQATVYRFYQHLKCRQGWVLDLIDALRQNNAGHLADELQHVYDSSQVRPPAPAAASFPPVASDACPTVTSIGAQTPSPEPNRAPGAPLAERPCQDLPVGDHALLLPSAATTTSADLDARAPVQESLPKKFLEEESPRPPPPGCTVHDGVSDGCSEEGHLPRPIKAVQAAVGTPGAGSQHPVCVDNGCFGNANHLHRGAPGLGLRTSLPPRGVGAARSPQQPRNEPEEDFYVSTESAPRLEEATRSGGPQPPDSLPKKQAVLSSGHGEAPGSFVDVRSPLLIQQQFDAEQKLVGMLREHGGDGDTQMETTMPVATPVPRDASLSCNTSLKPPVPEEKLPAGQTASSTRSLPAKEKVGDLSCCRLHFIQVFANSPWSGDLPLQCKVSSWQRVYSGLFSPLQSPGFQVPLSSLLVSLSFFPISPSEPLPPCPAHSPSPGSYLDPLMVSTDSSSSGETVSRVSLGCPAPAAHADPREEEVAGASRDSRPLPSWDSTSLGTHEVRVDHYPSTQLEAGSSLQDRAGSRGNSPVFDSSRDRGIVTSSSQARGPPGDSDGPSLPYIIPAVGIAVISAVGFLVYARLQK